MLRKLFSLKPGAKSAHPLGSSANVAELLAAIPPEPTRILPEVDHWLADCGRFEDEIGVAALLRAVLQLDAAAAPARAALLERYLSPTHRQRFSEALWAMLDQNLAHTVAAYRHCLERLLAVAPAEVDAKELLVAVLRGIAAQAVRKKLARFRYRPADAAWWRDMHALLSIAGRLGVANQAQFPFDGMAKKLTPLQLYLAAAYIEMAPLANIVAQQVEVIDHLLLESADTLELAANPGATSTHRIDLAGDAGPQPIDAKAGSLAGAVRYLSRARLRPVVSRLAADLRVVRDVPPGMASSGIDRAQLQQLGVLLMQHWSAPPPQRGKARHAMHDELRVVSGFTLARRMIAFTDFVRSGRSLEYHGGDVDLQFNEHRFGGLVQMAGVADDAPATPSPLVIDPLAALEKFELAGDRQMMETWQQTDISETGLGATAPAVRARHRIGGLVCLRAIDSIDWRLGLIRRIGRDPKGNATFGLQTLPWPSLSARVKPLAEESAAAWSKLESGGEGYHDAILVSRDGDEMLLLRDAFVPGLGIVVRLGDEVRRMTLTTLLERGEDFDHVRFVAAD